MADSPLVSDARSILSAGIDGVRPSTLLDRIEIEETLDRPLSEYRDVVVVGGGKASLVMAGALEQRLNRSISDGQVVVPHGYRETVPDRVHLPDRVAVAEGGHPVPDEEGRQAAGRILDLVQGAGEDDLVIVLISGGGSALLPRFAEDISLQDAQRTFELLLECGADIYEVNAVRKHCSVIGGGQLARAIAPAEGIGLVISDVVGDDLSVIASGPTVPDPSSFHDAVRVLKHYEIWRGVPSSVREHLQAGVDGRRPETASSEDVCFEHVHTHLLGRNRDALDAAHRRAADLDYRVEIAGTGVTGEAREVGREIAMRLVELDVEEPRGLIWGGETTVTVTGDGKGGRNQEMVLAAGQVLAGVPNRKILFLSAGTDGIDGPTDAAGAWIMPQTVQQARSINLEPDLYLANNNSYAFFDRIGNLIRTGPTHTNVMDLQVGLLLPGDRP